MSEDILLLDNVTWVALDMTTPIFIVRLWTFTPEAEIIVAFFGHKSVLLPSFDIWDVVLPGSPQLGRLLKLNPLHRAYLSLVLGALQLRVRLI